MPVKTLRKVGVWLGLCTAMACGPDPVAKESTWMLGVWSSEQPGALVGGCGVGRMEIRDDGVLIEGGGMESTCLSNPEPEGYYEYTWERIEDDAIDARRPTYPDSGFRITRGEDCNKITVQQIANGEVDSLKKTYHRGKVCAALLCPEDVGNCVEYKTKWCDEEDVPPACDDAEMP